MIKINMIPKTNVTMLTCSQGDTTLRKWTLSMYNGSQPWQIDFETVNLICSNGATVPGTIDGTTVVVDATAELTAKAGAFACMLEFTKDTQILHSQTFMMIVEAL